MPFWSNYPSDAISREGIDKLLQQQKCGLHDLGLVQEVQNLYETVMGQWTAESNDCTMTIIHGDWHAWNVIFNEHHKIEYILDFDGLQRGERIHDIAYFIWSIRNRLDHEKIGRSFMDGYGALSDVEIDLLPVAVARASVFFLCTASYTANPTAELIEQMNMQKPYIEWALSIDGQRHIRSLPMRPNEIDVPTKKQHPTEVDNR